MSGLARVAFVGAVGTLGLACAAGWQGGAPPPGGSTSPSAPAESAKCRVAASQSSPLVTEWPASEKANLEAMLGMGSVAVAYSGCSMRVLSQCRLGGTYYWLRTTPATDVIEIGSEDELYAKLPLGAVSLEGELKRAGELRVQTTISGQLKLGEISGEVPPVGECAQATHIVGALSVGAFSLYAGARASGRAGAGVAGVAEGGAGATRTQGALRAAGDVESCNQATAEAPNANCMSPIQVFLHPIPGRVQEDGPPGSVKVEFVSASASGRWDVYYDDEVICSTPCARWLDPHRPVSLRSREEDYRGSDRIELFSLDAHGPHVQLQAHRSSTAKFANGVVFTTLGGMAVATGVALTAIGAGKDRPGMLTAGLITMGVGIPVTAGAIWMLVDSGPRAEVVPIYADNAPAWPRNGRLRIVWGPGSLAGTF